MLKELEPQTKTARTLWLMKNYGVSFDLDGVIAYTSQGSIKRYNGKWGLKYGLLKSTQDLNHYFAMTDWLTEIKSKYPDAIDDPMQEAILIWNDEGIQRNAPLEQGIIALLRLMYVHQINPYELTSRPFNTKDATEYWLRTKFSRFGDLTDRLHMQSGSNLNPEFKADRAEKLGVLFHFEDSGLHAEKIAERGIIVGLVHQPWNQDYFPTNPLIVRPTKYQGRSEIIRTFLTINDFVAEKPDIIDKLIESHNLDTESFEV